MTTGAADPVAVAPDPSAALQRAFAHIHETRMRDMPLVNDALRVEAVGFRPWNGLWLGVLVTPWFINLMLLPDQPALWPRRRVGEKVSYAFPAGHFEFIAGREALIGERGDGEAAGGEYLSCSLFSPVFEFADQATARMVAEMSLTGLFDEANFEVPDMRVSAARPQTLAAAAAQAAAEAAAEADADAAAASEARTDADGSAPQVETNLKADAEARTESAQPVDVSKRDFLRGRWHGENP